MSLEHMPAKMDISADEEEVGRLLTRARTLFNVPDYQRRYAWDEDQWDDFWDDLQTLLTSRPKHFLGSIVVIKSAEGELDQLELVDSQQRIATIAVLFSVLQKELKDRGERNKAKKIQNKLEFEYQEEDHQRVNLTKYDQDNFEAILDGNWTLVDESGSQIVECYEWFSQKVDNLSTEELNNVRICLSSSMSVVKVSCDSEMSAFRLFETLNNRGLNLSPVDLMKNHLFQKISEPDDIDASQIKDLWEAILTTLDGDTQKLQNFFQNYIMATKIAPEDKAVTRNTLYDFFTGKLDIVRDSNETDINQYISDMLKKARVYDRLSRNKLNRDDVYNQDPTRVNEKLRDFGQIDVESVYILLLRALEELDNRKNLLTVMRLAEVMILRRRIVGRPTGTDEKRIFAKTTSIEFDKPDVLEAIKSRFTEHTPSRGEFKTSVQTESFKRSDRTRYVLDMLERHGFDSGGMSKVRTLGDVDIEHIAPRRMTADKYTNWVEYLDIDAEEFERKYRDRIGNLTLLESGANRSNRNDLFEEKVSDYEESTFLISNNLADSGEWSIDKIESRSEELGKMAADIWNYSHIT